MVFQATTRGWRGVAVGLLLLPALAQGDGVARAQSPRTPTGPGVHAGTATGGKAGGAPAGQSPGEAARQLMKQARLAFDRKDYARARALAAKAKALDVSWRFWEESPDDLLEDIREKSAEPAAAKGTPKGADPAALVERGREALKAGKLELAQDLARRAEAAGANRRWGLFEDSPARLLRDVLKAKARRDQEEADRLLAAARKLFEQPARDREQRLADLEKAQQMASRAAWLHGPYSIWDLGDRPNRLIEEIEAERAKVRTAQVPPPVRRPDDETRAADARPAPAPEGPPGPSPFRTVRHEQPSHDRPGAPAPVRTAAMAGVEAPAPAAPAADPATLAKKQRAEALVREARGLHARARANPMPEEQAKLLAGAREKLLEAQKLMAPFGPGEDSPAKALQELVADGRQRINEALAEAHRQMNKAGGGDRTRAAAALDCAEHLAAGLGLDPQPIRERRAAYRLAAEDPGLRAAAVPAPAAAPPAPGAAPAHAHGRELLEKARLELRGGNTEAARQLAIEAFTGPYQVQAEAQALLRTIEAEEFTQRQNAAVRALENGLDVYQNREYAQALAIFQNIDPNLLPPAKQTQWRELLQSARDRLAKAQPGTARLEASPELGGLKPAQHQAAAEPPAEAPSGPDSLAQQVKAMQEVQFQKLRAEGLKVQSEATAMFGRGETDAALAALNDYLAKVKKANIDPNKLALLQRPVEYRLDNFKLLKRQKDFYTQEARELRQIREGMTTLALNEQNKKREVADLMKRYHALLDEGKYREAQVLAMKAHELDPDDPATQAAIHIAKVQAAQSNWDKIKERKAEHMLEGINDAHDPGEYVDSSDPIRFDPEVAKRNRDRAAGDGFTLRARTERERAIESKLNTLVPPIDFKNVPLEQVIDDLRVMTGLNIIPDVRAMEEENISLQQPVTLRLGPQISLKSMLNILCRQVRLTHVIEDDVLKLTTEKHARGKLITRTFSVADLVIPIDNYALPESSNLSRVLENVTRNQGPAGLLAGPQRAPASPFAAAPGTSVGSPSTMTTAPGQPGGQLINQFAPSPMGSTAFVTSAKNTMEDALIKLITNTVAPGSWSDVGGPGTIEYYDIGMALVVNQTADVIQEISDLLQALRKLQDLEVSVEVRIITLSESFFERIGMDFALNIKTDNTSFEPQLTTQQFAPAPFLNDINVNGVTTGLTPAGTFTSDLDIPIRSSSFQYAIPPFGGYPNNPGFNGGLSLGLAFLNDIQVFMFMEAAQGDRRINVMQAPKITMFNGQTATILISDFQFFVTGLTAAGVAGGQIFFIPTNQPFPTGVTLTVQSVVSADRRFVRLNLVPSLSSTPGGGGLLGGGTGSPVDSTLVPLFPITTFVIPVFEGGSQGQPVPFTQFLQQPSLKNISISTTVSVPDGGTVLLGGMKIMREGRNEFGPPVLSKIPYVNRLFKNVGYGREAESLLFMVTPRIIINSEEEIRQTGLDAEAERLQQR